MIRSTLTGRRGARTLALLAAVPLLALGAIGAVSSASASAGGDQVTFCHATNSAKNPFVVITTDASAIVGGHDGHTGDVIPAFDWATTSASGRFAGLNVTGREGPNFFDNGCVAEPPSDNN